MTQFVRVIWRYEMWFTPERGEPRRLFRFTDLGLWQEELTKAREGLGAVLSGPGLLEVRDRQTGAILHTEEYSEARRS